MQDDLTTRRHAIALLAQGLALLGPAGLLAGCSDAQSIGATSALQGTTALTPPRAGEPVKVALLLPLEAGIQISLVGKGMKQAAELALFERNAPGLQLLVRDDKGTPEGAVAAASDAIANGAEIILGPLLSGSVKAVAPVARAANVPVIAFSNDPTVGGRGVHLLSFFASTEARRVASYAVGRGRKTFAAFIPKDVTGADTEAAFRQAVETAGGSVALIEAYEPTMSGLLEPGQRLADGIHAAADGATPIDALFLPSSQDNVALLGAMLRRNDIDTTKVQLLVTSGWDEAAAMREPKARGAWLAAPDPRGWRAFVERFGKAYQAMPPRVASLAYDAVMVAGAFAGEAKGRRFVEANLGRRDGFAGIDGQFRLTAAGPIERSLAVLELGPQGPIVIDAAAGQPQDGGQPSVAPPPPSADAITTARG